LEELLKTGEPILVSKGRKVQAVLITRNNSKEDFWTSRPKETKKQLLETIKGSREDSLEAKESVAVLRELRGYEG